MMQIISAVCARRMAKIETAFGANNHGVSQTIHLSKTLFDEFLSATSDAFRKQINSVDKDSPWYLRVRYSFMGYDWIICVARGICADPDVEAEILNQIRASRDLKSALKVCYKSLCTYGPHPVIDAQVEKVFNQYDR